MRHDELLDPGCAQRTGRNSEARGRAADQRYRDEDAGGGKQPATGGAEGIGHGAAGAGDQAWRIWATIFFREGAFGIGRHPFRAPTLPLDEVKDPTGAGDSFAGGFMGYLASQEELNREVLKRALFYGGVMGSFAVESFGTERLQSLT